MKNAVKSMLRTISAALVLCTLFGVLAACASNKDEYKQSSSAIPEGWEVVSENDGVTHIRMKEGSDAYHWVYGANETKFFLDLEFPGTGKRSSMKPDSEGNINLFVYFGYDHVARMNDAGTPLEPTDLDSFQLVFNDLAMYHAYKVLYEFDVEAVTTSSNVTYATPGVGLTEAVIYSIPISEMVEAFDEMSCLIRFDYRNDNGYLPEVYPTAQTIYNKVTIEYYKMNGMIHFNSGYVQTVSATFPYVLYELHGIIYTLFTLIAIVLIVLCTKRRWNRLIPLIPCVVGVIFSNLARIYYEGFPTDVHDMFGGFEFFGEELTACFAAIGFALLAILSLIIRGVVELLRRSREKREATAQASVSDE